MNKLIAFLAILAGAIQTGYVGKTIPATTWQLRAGSHIENLPDQSTIVEAGYGSTFSANLGVSPLQLQGNPPPPSYSYDGIYQLSFWVDNYFPKYPGYYTVEVDFGTQELCETSGWGTRNWTQVSLTCPSPEYIIIDQQLGNSTQGGPAEGAQNLVIKFSVPGWQLLFKNVSLTFTPTP